MPHILLTIEKGILFDVILARQGLSIVQGIPSNQFLAHTTYHLSKRAHAIIVKDQGVREKGLDIQFTTTSTNYAGTIPTGRNCSSLHRQRKVYRENELYWLHLAHFATMNFYVRFGIYINVYLRRHDESIVQVYRKIAKRVQRAIARYRRYYNRHVLRI